MHPYQVFHSFHVLRLMVIMININLGVIWRAEVYCEIESQFY